MKPYDFDAEQKADEILEMIGKELGENRVNYMRALLDDEQPDPKLFAEDDSSEITAPVISKGSRHTLRRVLILAAVLIVMMGLVVVTSEGVRLKLSGFFFDEGQNNTRVFDDSRLKVDVSKVELGYVPEGFGLLSDELLMDGYRMIVYQSISSESITIMMSKTELYSYNVDNENFKHEEVKINEHQAYLFNDNDQNIILWQVGDSTFQITADLGTDELVEIAKNVWINP